MKRLLNWLSRRRFPYVPLINVEISRSRLLDNLAAFQSYVNKLVPGAMVAPVLKSNAYGHGLFEVAGILEHVPNIPFFVVDSYFEAVALRMHGAKVPTLIIGYTRPETIAHSRLSSTSFTITSIDLLRRFHPDAPPCPDAIDTDSPGKYSIPHSRRILINLKIDTGMRRQGILPSEIDEAIGIIKENHNLILDSICTHLCDADDADGSFTEGQINVWNRATKQLTAAFPHIRYIHAAATDGSRLSADIAGNVVRLGIGLYGLSENQTLNASVPLKPALSIKTIVTGVKKLASGETIGYDNTYQAPLDMKVATIPVGYSEGLDRRLSSGPAPAYEARGFVQVGPKHIACPIIGRVSMNIASIDVTAVPGAAAGMGAAVVSDNANDPNSIAAMARACGTITYETVVKIPSQLKRTVVD